MKKNKQPKEKQNKQQQIKLEDFETSWLIRLIYALDFNLWQHEETHGLLRSHR